MVGFGCVECGHLDVSCRYRLAHRSCDRQPAASEPRGDRRNHSATLFQPVRGVVGRPNAACASNDSHGDAPDHRLNRPRLGLSCQRHNILGVVYVLNAQRLRGIAGRARAAGYHPSTATRTAFAGWRGDELYPVEYFSFGRASDSGLCGDYLERRRSFLD